jgi:GTP-sensing pleiotropic transcriptional regulator CodY
MSTQLQIAFTKADEQNNKLKELKQILKDELESSITYKELTEKMAALTANKKAMIDSVLASNKKIVEQIDNLKLDLESQKQLVSDVALKDYLAGEEVKVNKKGRIYRPEFSCKFIKTDETVFPKLEKLNSK